MKQADWEQTVAEFENEFAQGRDPDLIEYQGRATDDPEMLFVELLHVDLELRVRNGEKIQVEDYLVRFPRLRNNVQLVEDLIRTEFQARSIVEPGLTVEKFFARLPSYSSRIRQQLNGDLNGSRKEATRDANKPDVLNHSDSNSRFRKEGLHRQGGLGDIYLARDEELQRKVVIKEIKPRFSSNSAHRSRFAREIRITSDLQHPGIVPIYGFGEINNGSPYFAMQYIEGKTLTSAIKTLQDEAIESGEFDEREFRRLLQHFLDVCQTVHYAHQRNIVHRDIKPDNIMLGQFGETYVVDWGLAKVLDEERAMSGLDSPSGNLPQEFDLDGSRAGEQIGSPGFMSPEQAQGRHDEVDARSDVFSLGCTLSAMLNHVDGRFRLPSRYIQLKSISQQAVASSREERYASAADLADDIENFQLDRSTAAHSDSLRDVAGRFSRKHRGILNTALVALTLLSAVSLASAFWINQSRDKAVAAQVAEESERFKAETALEEKQLALQEEASARALAESRTKELSYTLHLFTDYLAKQSDKGELGALLQKALELEQYDKKHMFLCFIDSYHARKADQNNDYRKSSICYKKAITNLREAGVPETDSLNIAAMYGHCLAQAKLGNEEVALEIAEQIINALPAEIHDKRPWESSRVDAWLVLHFYETTKLKAKSLVNLRRYEEALEHVSIAKEHANKNYPSFMHTDRFISLRFVETKVHRGMKNREKAVETYFEIISILEENEIVDANLLRAYQEVGHLAMSFDRKMGREQLEKAYLVASKLYGLRDLRTARLKMESFIPLAASDDAQERQLVVRAARECREIQLEKLSLSTGDVLQTTYLMILALMKTEDPASNAEAVKLVDETLEAVYSEIVNERSREQDGLLDRMVAHNRSKALKRIGEFDKAIPGIEKFVEYVVKVDGDNANRLSGLKKQVESLQEEKMSMQDAKQ